MLTTRTSFALTVATASLPLSFGCVDEGVESEEQSLGVDLAEADLSLGEAPSLLFDGCRTAVADKTYYVTSATSSLTVPSPHGGYGYDFSDFCNKWVVDFKFATYSPQRMLMGFPYDLPSSISPGTTPKNVEDCQRLRVATSIYVKKSTETSFALVTSKVATGVWQGSSCYVPVATAYASASASGWDTYRVAVSTKLRASWQQTAAMVQLPPPK